MDTYYKINGERLTEIADAIRGKTGGTAKLTLDEMAEAIRGISGGSCRHEHKLLDLEVEKSTASVV